MISLVPYPNHEVAGCLGGKLSGVAAGPSSMNMSPKHALKQIALDGPSASGKTTIGKMLAQILGFRFLDTGLMYRAVTLIALRESVPLDDVDALEGIADSAEFVVNRQGDKDWRLIVNNEDLTDLLHTDRINQSVSQVSAISEVRRALVLRQREIASQGHIVMAGRDIGTVVLADAPVKIFLHASAETRAKRRTEDDEGNIDGQEYEGVLQSIQRRDEIDSNRADSPLRPAENATIVDNSDLTPEGTVEKILSLIDAEKAAGVA